MARRVSYVEVEDRNPFGEAMDESVFQDTGFTSNWVPGYSDVRRQREIDMAEGKEVQPLAHRFHWIRDRNTDNSYEARKVSHWVNEKHYTIEDYDKLVEMGYPLADNPGITKDPDGRARWGEHVLGVAAPEVAAAHYQKNLEAMAEEEQRAHQATATAVEEFTAATGTKAVPFQFAGDDPDEKPARKGAKK